MNLSKSVLCALIGWCNAFAGDVNLEISTGFAVCNFMATGYNDKLFGINTYVNSSIRLANFNFLDINIFGAKVGNNHFDMILDSSINVLEADKRHSDSELYFNQSLGMYGYIISGDVVLGKRMTIYGKVLLANDLSVFPLNKQLETCDIKFGLSLGLRNSVFHANKLINFAPMISNSNKVVNVFINHMHDKHVLFQGLFGAIELFFEKDTMITFDAKVGVLCRGKSYYLVGGKNFATGGGSADFIFEKLKTKQLIGSEINTSIKVVKFYDQDIYFGMKICVNYKGVAEELDEEITQDTSPVISNFLIERISGTKIEGVVSNRVLFTFDIVGGYFAL